MPVERLERFDFGRITMTVAFTGVLGTEWTATITGDISASNFDGNIIPGAGTDIVVGGPEFGKVADISNNVYQNYPLVPVSINNLEVLAGGTVNANASLMTINGSLVNSGSFNINSDTVKVLGGIVNEGLMAIDGESQSAYLLMDSGTFTLSGTGNLRMTSAIDGTAFLTGRDGELTLLTNDSRISGTGYIGQSAQQYYPGGPLAIINNGVVDANSSGRNLVIVQGTSEANPLMNNGSLVANGNGRLVIDQAYVEQTASGVIGAYGEGSTVTLADVVVRGGFVDTSGGGTIYLELAGGYGADGSYNGAVLDGSTASGAVTVTETAIVRIGLAGRGGQAGGIEGSIVNHGSIGVSGYQSYLTVYGEGATLTGGGEVLLNYDSYYIDGYLTGESNAATTAVLTNVDNLIHGSGTIGYFTYIGDVRQVSVVNAAGGIIQADNAGYALTIDRTVAFDNSGIVRATGGAMLELGTNTGNPAEITEIDNDEGRIVADGDGSLVEVRAATLRGGTIEAVNGGVVRLLSAAFSTVDGSTSEGLVTIADSLEVFDGMIRGGIVNQGEIVFNDAANARLIIAEEGATLSGGVVRLQSTDTVTHFITGESAETVGRLANAGTIEGSGYIGSIPGFGTTSMGLDNTANGLVRTLAGGTITIATANTIANEGMLQADGGTLDIQDLITGGGALSVVNGGTLKLRGDLTAAVSFGGAGIDTLTFSSIDGGWSAAGILTIDGLDVGDLVNLGYSSGLSLFSPDAFGWTQAGANGTFAYALDISSTRQFVFEGLTQTHFKLVDNGLGGVALERQAVTEGLERSEIFAGTADDDRIVGYGGDDLFAGSAGNDIFDGGDGIDTVSYAAASAKVSVLLDDGDLGQEIGIDQGSDIFRFVENTVGSAFGDSLTGDAAANQLAGGKGKDTLAGNAGNDRLFGEAGGDLLTGGTEADTFLYFSIKDSTAKAKGRDTIFDFSRADGDRIDLDAIDANTKLANDQDFSFIKGKDFSGKAGQLRFEKDGDETYLYGDTNGDRKADFSILFDDGLKFRAGDFLL
jgi:hypothetical protein